MIPEDESEMGIIVVLGLCLALYLIALILK